MVSQLGLELTEIILSQQLVGFWKPWFRNGIVNLTLVSEGSCLDDVQGDYG